MTMSRIILFALLAPLLAACANISLENGSDEAIGDFRLGHAIVVAPDPVRGPVSRAATPEEWIAAVDAAIEAQMRDKFTGQRFYHLGVAVVGYALAPPGIPIVAAPKSILILQINMWDDSTGDKLTKEPFQLVVGEGTDGDTFLSSGLTRTREEQIEVLAARAAVGIEDWLRRSAPQTGWFDRPPPPPEESADALLAAAGQNASDADTNQPNEVTADVTPRARTDGQDDG